MPHYKVIMSGSGIDYPIDGLCAVGFFTTRLVRAPSLHEAESKAKELVRSDWLGNGPYAGANRGSVPALAVEQSFEVGIVPALFGRKPSGYSFYRHED